MIIEPQGSKAPFIGRTGQGDMLSTGYIDRGHTYVIITNEVYDLLRECVDALDAYQQADKLSGDARAERERDRIIAIIRTEVTRARSFGFDDEADTFNSLIEQIRK